MALMADPIANTWVPKGPGQASLEFEDLRDEIEMLTPEETPLYSNFSKGPLKALRTDWGTADLGPITAADAEKRGFEASIRPAITPARLDNIAQLAAETGSTADSYDVLDLAGRDNESDWQELMKGRLLRRKINKLLYANQAKSNIEPTKMATIVTFIAAPRFVSIATTPGVASAGNGTTAYVPGTGGQPLDSIVPIDDMMEAAYATGDVPEVLYMSPRNKRAWSKIPDASVAENRVTMTAGTPRAFAYYGTVDMYLSDFGLLDVAVDRDAPTSYILAVNPNYAQIATLPGRAFKKTALAKTGSSKKFMIEWEGTLKVYNPTGHGMVEGIAYT